MIVNIVTNGLIIIFLFFIFKSLKDEDNDEE